MRPSATRTRVPGAAVLLAAYCVSRVLLVALGFHFEPGLLTAVQDVDPELLRHHLLQSLWYLHGQPPLWNAILGLSLKAFGPHWAQAWHVCFLALGAVEVLALAALLRGLGLGTVPAGALALGFSVTPAVLLTENEFFYDYPTLVALTLTVLAVGRFVRRPGTGRGLAVFGGAAYLVLTRTLFQVWWLLLLGAVLLVACRGARRVVLLSAAVPLALVLGVYAKNIALYGVPSTTSWTGMGVARVAVTGLPLAERRRLVAQGKLHAVSLVKPLAPLAQYEAVGIRPHPPTGIPLLDEADGPEYQRNLENRTYIAISRDYWSDDLWIVRHRTGAYLSSVGRGLADFFASPTLAWGGEGNDARIRGYDHWFTRIAYGRLGPGKVGLFLVAAYLAALAGGLAFAAARLRPGAGGAEVTAAFAALTVLYVTLVGNVAEVGENFRFRLVLDPLVLALLAGGVNAVVRRRAAAARPGRAASPAAPG